MKPAETADSGVRRTRPCLLYRDTALDDISSYSLRLIDFYGKSVDAKLDEDSVIREFRITAASGKTYDTKHYNLKSNNAIRGMLKHLRQTRNDENAWK